MQATYYTNCDQLLRDTIRKCTFKAWESRYSQMGKCSVDPEISKRKDQLFASMQARKKTDIQESESDTDYTYLIGQYPRPPPT